MSTIQTKIKQQRDYSLSVRSESFEPSTGTEPIHCKWDIDLVVQKKTGRFRLRIDGFGFFRIYRDGLLDDIFRTLWAMEQSPNHLGQEHWEEARERALDQLDWLSGSLDTGYIQLARGHRAPRVKS
jgi:hypothetical protein